MARVEIYTTSSCPYCIRAKRLLEARGIPFSEIDVGSDDVVARAGELHRQREADLAERHYADVHRLRLPLP